MANCNYSKCLKSLGVCLCLIIGLGAISISSSATSFKEEFFKGEFLENLESSPNEKTHKSRALDNPRKVKIKFKSLHLNEGCTEVSIGSERIHRKLNQYFPVVKEASKKYDVPCEWIFAIILEESTARNVETKWAVGPMQLEKSIWTRAGYSLEELRDEKKNIMIATEFLGSFDTTNIYEALGRYGRGNGGWRTLKRNCAIEGDVSSFEEAVKVLDENKDINFIFKMEKWRQRFNQCYSID